MHGRRESGALGEPLPARGRAAIFCGVNADEIALVERARDGDRASFGTLVDRYRGRVYALEVSVVGDHEAAVALTRDTFVRAWTALPTLSRAERFPAWLSRIAYRAGVERRIPPTTPGPVAPRPGESPRDVLARTLDALPEPQRVAIDLRFREGLGYAEIAETLDMDGAAVRALVAKAAGALREQLAPMLRAPS